MNKDVPYATVVYDKIYEECDNTVPIAITVKKKKNKKKAPTMLSIFFGMFPHSTPCNNKQTSVGLSKLLVMYPYPYNK